MDRGCHDCWSQLSAISLSRKICPYNRFSKAESGTSRRVEEKSQANWQAEVRPAEHGPPHKLRDCATHAFIPTSLAFNFLQFHMFRVATRSPFYQRASRTCLFKPLATMNRPRNRQPRHGRDNKTHTPRKRPRTPYSDVPNSQQVVPGASVSIVLKQDQPTGKEVQGLVQDLLSRGDHPRGMKVRVQDGRIGRVQRMWTGSSSSSPPTAQAETVAQPCEQLKFKGRRRGDADGSVQEPPPRLLSDYIPSVEQETNSAASVGDDPTFSSATIKCPICGTFEGDEAAVSHHIDEHLA